MPISQISDSNGYDAGIYDALKTQYTQTTQKTGAEFDAALLSAINSKDGSFMQGIDDVRGSLPAPQADTSYSSLVALPSFGANYMAIITEMSSEQRRQNAEMRALQTEEMVDKIQEQAETIRDKAITQLVTGIVTGALSIAQGAASSAIAVKGLSNNQKLADATKTNTIETATGHGTQPLTGKQALAALERAEGAAAAVKQNADMLLNTQVQSFNSIMGGANSVVGSIGQCVATMFDAELKESEADVERIRAQQQNLESLDESLKALIQKAISSQDAIQQNMNQTRTKILG